jgi:hypothetical protein
MTSGPTVIGMGKWLTAVAVVVGLAGVGLLVYWQWETILAVVLSPVGGFIAKVVFSGKVLKLAIGLGFAAVAGVVAVRRKLRRRGAPEPAVEYAPPVFGPPEEPALTSTETATATTTVSATAPASRPI